MVSALFIALLLGLKHLFIANIVDFGYTRARDTRNDYWWVAFAGWVCAELLLTDVILPSSEDLFVTNFVVVELLVLSCSTYCERRACIGWELKTHFAWETALLALYAICGIALMT